MNASVFADRSEKDESEADEPAAAPPSRLSLDEVYDLLSNRRRRMVVEFLRDDPETTLSALADHVATVENGRPDGSFTPEERKRAYVSLYQSHLPRLADAGVIAYDRDENTIAAGPTFDQVVAVLRPWQEKPESGGLAAVLSRLLPLRRG